MNREQIFLLDKLLNYTINIVNKILNIYYMFIKVLYHKYLYKHIIWQKL